MFLEKQHYQSYIMTPSQALTLVKKFMEICFSHSFHQLIMEPTRTAELTNTYKPILRNTSRKVIQNDVIETGLSDRALTLCSQNRHF